MIKKKKNTEIDSSNKDRNFWTLTIMLTISLVLFAVSMLDGSPRDILSLLAAGLAIMFAWALIKEVRKK